VVRDIAIGIAAGLALTWLALIAVLRRIKGRFDMAALRDLLRILPDLLRRWCCHASCTSARSCRAGGQARGGPAPRGQLLGTGIFHTLRPNVAA
jgi:hypothetical protein